jgi:D-lactate dehydrogenase
MELKTELASFLPEERVLTRPIERYAYANDASYFRLVPQAVVHPASTSEICSLYQFSQQKRIPLTFRAAGTSLSGQAISDGILVVLARHWGMVQVEEAGRRVRAQPGVVGSTINTVLKPLWAKDGSRPGFD